MFCGDGTDKDGDHYAWVEARRNYENNGKERILVQKQIDGSFKLFNKKWNGPMFCADGTDSHGDHWGFFEPCPTYENNGKERWFIEKQSDGFYKIFNKKWGGPLFCGDGKDSCGDHWVWVEPRRTYENNGKERWEFQRM